MSATDDRTARDLANLIKAQIVALQSNEDAEVAHVEADELLCKLLSQLGYDDVVAEWEKIGKWYA